MSFCINAVVAKVLKDYVTPPDYSELMRDINENHANDFVVLKQDGRHPTTGKRFEPTDYKVLFTTSDTIVVQEVQMSFGRTRFKVRKFHAKEWPDYYEGWVTWSELTRMWEDGCRYYGADL